MTRFGKIIPTTIGIPMKPRLVLTLTLLHLWTATAPAANVQFAGIINDNAGSQISEWRTATTVKTLDGDGDNLYGTAARLFYIVAFVGGGTVYGYGGSDAQVGPFPGYAVVDHPTVGVDLEVRTTTNGGVAGPDDVMFTFTALAGSPANVRVGVVTDGLNGAVYSPASIGLRQVGGGGSSAEHTLTAVNSTLDMVFFDVYGVTAGDQFEIFGDTGAGGYATHQIVTWDAIPAPTGPPVITTDPISVALVDGGLTTVTFRVVATGDAVSYEWFRNGLTTGVTTPTYTFSAVPADNGASYHCVATNGSGTDTSNPATLTIVPPSPQAATYRAALAAESSRIAFFPFDGDTGPPITNTVNATFGGTIRAGSLLTGNANRVAGTTALEGTAGLTLDPAWEFADDNTGTVEALLYQSSTAGYNPSFFSIRNGASVRYSLHGDAGGGRLYLYNGSTVSIWSTPRSMIGRVSHVAIVLDNGSATAYFDGLNLGTQLNLLGSGTGISTQIGSSTDGSAELWPGAIDELAIYSDALPGSAIASHADAWFGPLPVPKVTGVSTSGGLIFLTAPSVAGFRYWLEHSPDLAMPWQEVAGSGLDGTGADLILSAILGGDKGFYRVCVTR